MIMKAKAARAARSGSSWTIDPAGFGKYRYSYRELYGKSQMMS